MFQGDAVPSEERDLLNALKQGVFWFLHLAALFIFWVGFSWTAFWVCIALYGVRMFAITGGFHRYFSHHSYKTSRWFQFVLAFLGTTSAQKGPIWWASHHRHHHRYSDKPEDIHSPIVSGIYYAHVGWVLSKQFIDTRVELVRDLLRFPELRLLDKFNLIPPILLALGTYTLGMWFELKFPELGTNGPQMLVWGFVVSTVLLYHGTFCINSFCHLLGRRRFQTADDSKNSLLLALITLGEGWHNNHHRYPGSERQGFYWWEIDMTHYILVLLSKVGIVWDLRRPPQRILDEVTIGAS